MNKSEMQKQITEVATMQEKICMRLDALEVLRKGDSEESISQNKKTDYYFKKIDDYIVKQTTYKEFKEEHKASFRKNLTALAALMAIIAALTGWGFFEKGLSMPVPGENNFTVTPLGK